MQYTNFYTTAETELWDIANILKKYKYDTVYHILTVAHLLG